MIPKSLNNPELNEIRRKYQAVMKKPKEIEPNKIREMSFTKLKERWEENSK